MSELLQKVVHAADQRLAEDLVVLDFRMYPDRTLRRYWRQ